MKEAIAKGYHKVLAYKDEYEVGRLLQNSSAKAQAEFEGDLKLTYHLAPPVLSGQSLDGRPKKREFGGWMTRVFPMLAGMKRLRGTPFDPFGYSSERRMERALIRQYEDDMREILKSVNDATVDVAVELAELPLQIRGFGPVKKANYEKAKPRRTEMLAVFRGGGVVVDQAAE